MHGKCGARIYAGGIIFDH